MSQSRSDAGQSMEEILASIRRIIAEGEREAQDAPVPEPRPTEPAGEKAPPAPSGPAAPPPAEPEILVLTQMVQDDGSVVSLQGESQAAVQPAAGHSSVEKFEFQITSPALPKPEPEPEPRAPAPERIEVSVETVVAAAFEPLKVLEAADAEVSKTNAIVAAPPGVEALGLSLTTTPLPEERTAVPAEAPKKPEIVSEEALAASTAALSQLAQSVTRAREPAPGQSKTVDELVREAVEPMLKQWLDANLPRLVERMVREAIDRVVRRVE